MSLQTLPVHELNDFGLFTQNIFYFLSNFYNIFFKKRVAYKRKHTSINDYWACVMVQCRWWLRHVFFFCVIHFVPGCLCVYFLPRCIKLIHAFSPCSYLTSYFISWFSFPCAFLLLLFPLSRHLGFSSAVSCSPRWPPLPWLPFCVCI